jgi:hypothetical protein
MTAEAVADEVAAGFVIVEGGGGGGEPDELPMSRSALAAEMYINE